MYICYLFQKAIRSLYQREKEYKKNLGKTPLIENETAIGEGKVMKLLGSD